ncbi:hypothetical protein CkaCkLH20_13180 [Colletotrichum karsti]|uniref:Uncharacterized protein n=1 Tax=Colletotrichum karsti TaxID=1095194 RepID=A0A9P6LEK9_9PEZI|nr:uncharacterized protein CkaCkLH20_13180 [Colletotrichum karsti]KAF9869342.1 hypothetical protein CkaCkLH20_13180 [Colletotrichum karsti]
MDNTKESSAPSERYQIDCWKKFGSAVAESNPVNPAQTIYLTHLYHNQGLVASGTIRHEGEFLCALRIMLDATGRSGMPSADGKRFSVTCELHDGNPDTDEYDAFSLCNRDSIECPIDDEFTRALAKLTNDAGTKIMQKMQDAIAKNSNSHREEQ